LDSSIPVEIEIEEDALLNEQKTKQIQIQLKKREANAFYCSSFRSFVSYD
jgi:hypothetical protein